MRPLEILKLRIITADEVCEALQINRKTLNRWRRDLKFPAPIVAGKTNVRFDVSEIEAWLDEQKKNPAKLKEEKK